MKQNEVKELIEKLSKWEALDARKKEINAAWHQIESISGNFSEIRFCTITLSNRQGKEDVVLARTGLTDSDIRSALAPLIRKKYEEIAEQMDKL